MYLLDPVRNKKIKKTPEEVVRQKMIQYLNQVKGVPFQNMAVEYSFKIGPNVHRADIVVFSFNKESKDILFLVECKRPSQGINTSIEPQINKYLSQLNPEYLIVTNGDEAQYFQKTPNSYDIINDIPPFS